MAVSLDGLNAQMVGDVGERNFAESTVNQKVRLDRQGGMVTSNLHGFYAEQAQKGNVFYAANQAAVSTTAALATTWTGLGLANPSGNSYNFVLLRFGFAQVAAGVAGAVGLMYSTNSGLAAAITPVNAKLNGRASTGIVDNGATIATPVLMDVYGAIGSVATTAYGVVGGQFVQLDGSIVVPPGYSILTYTTAACTTAHIFSFVWEEVPV